jgi:hypothetical protein
MGTVVLAGATSGTTTLSPTDAVTATITLPSTTDTLVGKATTDTLTNKTLTSPTISGTPVMGASLITSGTEVASTSGTSIDFTGIPSWVKRITVMFNGVSTNGTSNIQIQLGDSGGIETSGYAGCAVTLPSTFATYSAGFQLMGSNAAARIYQGQTIISLMGSNIWTEFGILGRSDSTDVTYGAGSKTLSDTLTQIRITTVNGTDTFDAGSINLLWE